MQALLSPKITHRKINASEVAMIDTSKKQMTLRNSNSPSSMMAAMLATRRSTFHRGGGFNQKGTSPLAQVSSVGAQKGLAHDFSKTSIRFQALSPSMLYKQAQQVN